MDAIVNLHPVMRAINHNFDFLLSSGYKIRSKNLRGHGMLFWNIVFESPHCLLNIYKELNEVVLTFAPHNAIEGNGEIRMEDQICIQVMIYYLSKGEKFIGVFNEEIYRSTGKQLEILAGLVKTYIGQIEPYFGSFEFQMYKRDLLLAQREYNDLLVKHAMAAHTRT